MTVVSDTGPVQYLVHIGAVDVLPALYQRMLLPKAVAAELRHANAPDQVRSWIAQPPAWCEIHPDPPNKGSFAFLDPGEGAAIALALTVHADRLLIDDLAGRVEARHRGVRVTGTLGVLIDAHWHGLLDFEQALARLRQTNLYLSDEVIALARQELSTGKRKLQV